MAEILKMMLLQSLVSTQQQGAKIKYLNKVSSEQKQLLQEMFELIDTSDFKEALEKIEEIQKIKEIKFVYRFQARIYEKLENKELAIQSYQKMLKVKPNSKSTYYHLANLYNEMKNTEKEIEMLEEGVKIKPIIQKLLRLGELYDEKNEHNKCIQCADKAIGMKPKTKSYLMKIKSLCQLEQWDQALQCCDEVITKKPNKIQLHHLKLAILEGKKIEQFKKPAKFNKLQNMVNDNQQQQNCSEQQKQQPHRQNKPAFIKTAKQIENLNIFQDAFLYTFTSYIYVQINEGKGDYSENLAVFSPFMKVIKNVKVIPDFEFLITECLLKCYQEKIQNRKTISTELKKWFNKNKFQSKTFQEDFITILWNLSQMVENQVSDLLNESVEQRIQRQNQHPEFMLFLTSINEIFLENDCNIFKTSGGKYGLERAIKIIAFLVSFPELINAELGFDDQIYWIIEKQDDQEYFQSSQIYNRKNQNQDEINQTNCEFQPSKRI